MSEKDPVINVPDQETVLAESVVSAQAEIKRLVSELDWFVSAQRLEMKKRGLTEENITIGAQRINMLLKDKIETLARRLNDSDRIDNKETIA